jgi:hypothetical protein
MLGPVPMCYRVSEEALPWQEALGRCQEEGGSLVGFETEFEEYLLLNHISNREGVHARLPLINTPYFFNVCFITGRPLLRFYTNGNQLNDGGIWQWGTGEQKIRISKVLIHKKEHWVKT